MILTLALDDDSQACFDRLRLRFFPPARLVVGAHVTMFHAIPDEHEGEVAHLVQALCAATAIFPIDVRGLRFLGRGVAYDLASVRAQALRASIAGQFAASLTPQDKARWSPHVTIQNKVTPEAARQTQSVLASMPLPHAVTAVGLAMWRYRNGPWEANGRWGFVGA